MRGWLVVLFIAWAPSAFAQNALCDAIGDRTNVNTTWASGDTCSSGTRWVFDGDDDGLYASGHVCCVSGSKADDVPTPFTQAAISGTMIEYASGLGTDCDDTDEALPKPFFHDLDGDGLGAGAPVQACTATGDLVDNHDDCNDGDATLPKSWYLDGDGDGIGKGTPTIACAKPVGAYVTVNGDCNDANAAIRPGATEACNGVDDDCANGADDGLTFADYYLDADADTYGRLAGSVHACASPGASYVTVSGDCDDTKGAVHPGVTETCNGIDDDCANGADDGLTFTDWYPDVDADGFGLTASVTSRCVDPASGFVTTPGDCDDTKSAVNPDATEVCNGIDDDCASGADDGLTFDDWYPDVDSDTYGVTASGVSLCVDPGAGFVNDPGDCDDGRASVHPGATELCNNRDDDCDTSIDNDLTFVTYYLDGDTDTFGRATVSQSACAVPTGYVTDATDCDDFRATVHPGAVETCDGIDEDCDATPDDGLPTTTYYLDSDGDTYGRDSGALTTCAPPGGAWITTGGDCRDTDALAHPGATEICNNADDDCDSTIDEGVRSTFWRDVDGDGVGISGTTTEACAAPSGFVAPSAAVDCDDSRATVHPGASEVVGNPLDDDCDGNLSCWVDGDHDTVGTTTSGTIPLPANTCVAVGFSPLSTDCDDADVTRFPGAVEGIGDFVDQDCDGKEICPKDLDGDQYGGLTTGTTTVLTCVTSGFAPVGGDCDDISDGVHPGATELAGNPVDEDCDATLACYGDDDGDSYGTDTIVSKTKADLAAGGGTVSCARPDQAVATRKGDCNDDPGNGFAVHPGGTEIVGDRLDGDCDGSELCYNDQDQDAHGGLTTVKTTDLQCQTAQAHAVVGDDCDDSVAAVHPGAIEDLVGAPSSIGNAYDDNCDGVLVCFRDMDKDHFAALAGTPPIDYPVASFTGLPLTCDDAARQLATAPGDDCNDGNPAIKPGATEIPGDGVDQDCVNGELCYVDADNDGWGGVTTQASTASPFCSEAGLARLGGGDCDDTHREVHPNAVEVAGNAFDDDCNTFIECYVDADADGHGTVTTAFLDASVVVPQGTGCVTVLGGQHYDDQSDDCDDVDARRTPGKTESVGDDVDEDCDLLIACYLDRDGDSYGDAGPPAPTTLVSTGKTCSGSDGSGTGTLLADDATDCDDGKAAIHPGTGAVELVGNSFDEDCDLHIDCFVDYDGDGFGADGTVTSVASTRGTCHTSTPIPSTENPSDVEGDCADGDATVNPRAIEIPGDTIDGNCDDREACYVDHDVDGYGSIFGVVVLSDDFQCPTSKSLAKVDGDCDDNNLERHPFAVDLPADGKDQDCTHHDACWKDLDRDGFGGTILEEDPAIVEWGAATTCTSTGYRATSEDCRDCAPAGPCIDPDPSDAFVPDPANCIRCEDVHPGALERVGDQIDEDCDSQELCYVDADGDLAGGLSTIVSTDDAFCSGPRESATADDCDDTDPAKTPRDYDADGSGTCGAFPDCAPEDGTVGPAREEVCETSGPQVDNDCDGDPNSEWAVHPPIQGTKRTPVSATGGEHLYADVDGDGFGDGNDPGFEGCAPSSGYVTNNLDCNDLNARIFRGAAETCDGVDENCNLRVDEFESLDPVASRCTILFEDKDGDGTGDPTAGLCLCPTNSNESPTSGGLIGSYLGKSYVEPNTDCDDQRVDIRPNACLDGRDNDGDGTTDGEDAACKPDALGRVSASEDEAGSFELVTIDGHDNDCDGLIPLLELDCDDDGSFPIASHATSPPTITGASSVLTASGTLTACGPGAAPKIACWGEDLVVECDMRNGLWSFRYTVGDGYEGRFRGGVRILANTSCAPYGDCDDGCPTRCPGVAEVCDGVDNDCDGLEPAGASDTTVVVVDVVDQDGAIGAGDGVPDPLQPAAVDFGHVSLAEVDIDGDLFVSCEEDFALGLPSVQRAPSECAPFPEDLGRSDCNDLCYLTSAAGVEVCDGFLDTCGSTTVDGRDHDQDGFSTCGALGDPEGELPEQIFLPVWVSCAPGVGGAVLPDCATIAAKQSPPDTSVPPVVDQPWVPLVPPRPDASGEGGVLPCDSALGTALGSLLGEAIGDPITRTSTSLVTAICDDDTYARTGGLCTTISLTLAPDAGDAPPNAVSEACGNEAAHWSVRTVWTPERILDARAGVTDFECLRLFGEPCEQVSPESPRIAEGAPPNADAKLTEDPSAWWVEGARYSPTSLAGAVVSCWGDPFGGTAISAEVGGDCADDDPRTNRNMPEGPSDVLSANADQPFDCARCLDVIDNNCDGLVDCADPTCDVCFVGQGQGCAGGRDACAEPGTGGCASGAGGGLGVLLLPLFALRRRSRSGGRRLAV